jgi:hypothetical protein
MLWPHIVLAVPQLAVVMFAEPLKLVPLIVRAVCRVVAVPELPETDPVIVELNVLTPAKVWAPVVIAPDAVALAVGITALVPVDELTCGPAVVPAVHERLVPTLTCAPVSIPSSFVLSAAAITPARVVVTALSVAFVPVELVMGTVVVVRVP